MVIRASLFDCARHCRFVLWITIPYGLHQEYQVNVAVTSLCSFLNAASPGESLCIYPMNQSVQKMMWYLPHVAPFYEGNALLLLQEFRKLPNNASIYQNVKSFIIIKPKELTSAGFSNAYAGREAAKEGSKCCLWKQPLLSLASPGKWPRRWQLWPQMHIRKF
jgi:hypothetical protein